MGAPRGGRVTWACGPCVLVERAQAGGPAFPSLEAWAEWRFFMGETCCLHLSPYVLSLFNTQSPWAPCEPALWKCNWEARPQAAAFPSGSGQHWLEYSLIPWHGTWVPGSPQDTHEGPGSSACLLGFLMHKGCCLTILSWNRPQSLPTASTWQKKTQHTQKHPKYVMGLPSDLEALRRGNGAHLGPPPSFQPLASLVFSWVPAFILMWKNSAVSSFRSQTQIPNTAGC